MIPQYAAAAMCKPEQAALCSRISVDSIVSSNARKTMLAWVPMQPQSMLRVVDNLERILAIELFNAAQALEFRRPAKSSPYIEEFIASYRSIVGFIEQDRIMYKEMDKTVEFLRQGKFQRE
jgi:histidine ammonia-lyase